MLCGDANRLEYADSKKVVFAKPCSVNVLSANRSGPYKLTFQQPFSVNASDLFFNAIS